MLKNLVFFGSPDFSAKILESILASAEVSVVGVVTQPDKPLGRKQILTPSPVAQKAADLDLPVYKPSKLDEANLAHIKLLKPDIFLVVSYGKLIPPSWLNTPVLGTFNIHFSLLPKYRGALCISEAIKNGDSVTGVTLMKMDEQLDHGPIISQQEIPIEITDDVSTLTTKLTQAAQQLLDKKLPEICAQKYSLKVQGDSLATYTLKTGSLTRENSFIPYEKIDSAMSGIDAGNTSALLRSLTPEPGPWTKIGKQEVKIIQTTLENDRLVINSIQIPGKSPISWKQFAAGYIK
ncbi:MAG: Methionyl-tRNA formyltransferase [Candidatus Collierbacteria bacterium GW2011_GWF2_44_15]|uniref:Methionyl-tRNA formyltransferase n=4 Tax=Candidatus Collieribacteriota TaxID=1752725 RepID=A0A0G1HH66_9BACT|nr:MAG: Methionyl-tRNA formyltransferase [Candidatus Collierbacteria bacterium GW2011_GWA1_44_12]KKT38691.1 MAG: Methionyl-tRNA formyltransferase [Candidatus Collierbacteria bacterium GW2011_GWF1_44_12]KKT45883.1 MAG: Methionyl-tRNA formyltransferase [Candidatus Collierbacteria bacterium GW2011_GWF2_44_15]KKU27844.1 MAG: Methionyl-tRNA formyltransferase [Candidatus Collierbacteria bacterium GW2011_GWE1_46_18]